MKITFVLPGLNLSGGVRVVVIYAQLLIQMGHVIQIIAPSPKESSHIEKLRCWLKGRGWPSDRKQPASHLDGSGLDYKILDLHRPVVDADVPDADVVIATWWETAEWVDALGPSKGAKVYFIQHHEVFDFLPQERVRATYGFRMHKIVVAKWLQRLIQQEYGDEAGDLVPNSVDHGQFFAERRGKQNVPTVGLSYSATFFKGVDVSLAVLERLRRNWPELKVLSFGSSVQVASLKLPVDCKFYFCPAQDQIRNIYARCDVWLTASRSEGFNLPAMEAMACRTPVVSTRTGWPEEAIKSHYNGVLADVDDVDGLTRGVEWILSLDDADWRKISENAFATVADSSWRGSVAMFERSLYRAVERAKHGEIAGGVVQDG
jgi:glycosyltransferase involved in cell wall biosynthesis